MNRACSPISFLFLFLFAGAIASLYGGEAARAQPVPQRSIIGAPEPGSRAIAFDSLYFAAYDLKQARFSGHVSAITQDSRGYLWVGTSTGLARFDGHIFTRPYTDGADDDAADDADDDADDDGVRSALRAALGTHSISALLPLKDGRLAVATLGAGLIFWDPTSQSVESPAPASLAKLRENPTGSLNVYALSREADGTLLVGTDVGLLRVDPARTQIIALYPTGPVRAILRDTVGRLLLGLASGMGVWDHDRQEMIPFTGNMARDIEVVEQDGVLTLVRNRIPLGDVPVNDLLEDHLGRIWVSTEGGSAGWIEPATTSVTPLPYNTASELEFQHRWVYAIAAPFKDEIWFAIPEGIEVISTVTKDVVRHILPDPTISSSLRHGISRALFVDREGIVWIGSHETLLHRYNPANRAFTTLRSSPVATRFSTQSPLTQPDTRSVMEDDQGRIWAGSSHFGVDIIDLEKGQIGGIRSDPANPNGLRDAFIHSISQSPNGDIWIGGGNGVARFRTVDKRYADYRLSDGLPSDFIRVLEAGEDARMWVGTSAGLRIIDGATDNILHALPAEPSHPLSQTSIQAIAFAPDGTGYIATSEGLYAVTKGGTERASASRLSLGANKVRALSPRAQGGIWASTDAGLAFIIRQSITPVTLQSGKPLIMPGPIVEDDQGRVWSPPFVYVPAQNQQTSAQKNQKSQGMRYSIGAADGADIGAVNARAARRMRDGRLLFGGTSGVLIVDPARVDFGPAAKPATITAVQINGASSKWDGLSRITAPPNPRTLVFHLTRLGFKAPKGDQFRYRLLGYDDRWTNAVGRRAVFTNVGPGTYQFEVIATDRHGFDAPTPTRLSISVQPAWYQTQAFQVALGLGILGLLLAFYRYRIWRLRARERWLESEVDSRTRDLKAAQQQLVMQEKMASLGTLTAGVAHEINNPVNFTQVMIKELQTEHQDMLDFLLDLAGGDEADAEIKAALEERFSKLDDMTSTARGGTDRIQAIVRDLRTFTRLDRADRQETHLSDLIDATIHLARTRFPDIRFETKFAADPPIFCHPAKLNQVLLNLLVNGCEAVEEKKRTQPSLEGIVRFMLDQTGDDLVLKVSDNGTGISDDIKDHVFEPFFTTKDVGDGTGLGLAISYGVVAEHGGTLGFESAACDGTTMIMRLPLR